MKTLRLLRSKQLNLFQSSVYAHPCTLPIARAIHPRMISTRKSSLPHEERTAAEPRQNRLYNVRLAHIEQLNPTVRLLRLTIPPPECGGYQNHDEEEPQEEPFAFLPGQWLDVHVPSVSKAGGFSITSTPADARVLPSPEPVSDEGIGIDESWNTEIETRGRPPYVELAVQEAPGNPAGAWLWKPEEEILGKEVGIRVGGSFVWPPPGIDVREIRNVVFIAGGMGINPLISIISHLNNNDPSLPSPPSPLSITIFYAARLPKGTTTTTTTTTTTATTLAQIPFLSRLRQIIQAQSHSRRLQISLELFLTDLPDDSPLLTAPPSHLAIHSRRINRQDLQAGMVGTDVEVKHKETVCYLCGPPGMTDEFVGVVRELLGGEMERVLFEKWW